MIKLCIVLIVLACELVVVSALSCSNVVNGVLTVPASVTSIADNAFSSCIALTSVSFAAGS